VIAVGLTAEEWPQPSQSPLPPEFQEAVLRGEGATGALAPQPAWVGGRDRDQFGDTLRAAGRCVVVTRHTRTPGGDDVARSPLLDHLDTRRVSEDARRRLIGTDRELPPELRAVVDGGPEQGDGGPTGKPWVTMAVTATATLTSSGCGAHSGRSGTRTSRPIPAVHPRLRSGAGKSVVAHHVAAEDILRRYAAGDPTPEQHVAVVSFNRDEAADIVPAICDRLQAIVEHDLVPTAVDISGAELRYLRQRVRQAPYAGTIDGLLRGIFREFARDAGFDEMPSVGTDALLKRVHRDCYESLRDHPERGRRLRDLEVAYPDGEVRRGRRRRDAGGRDADVLPRSTPLDRGVPVGAGTDARLGVPGREARHVRRYRAIRRAICQR